MNWKLNAHESMNNWLTKEDFQGKINRFDIYYHTRLIDYIHKKS